VERHPLPGSTRGKWLLPVPPVPRTSALPPAA
jgi:hypothetical protein